MSWKKLFNGFQPILHWIAFGFGGWGVDPLGGRGPVWWVIGKMKLGGFIWAWDGSMYHLFLDPPVEGCFQLKI